MSDDIITVDDVVAVGACAWGIRRWFTERARDGSLPAGVTFRSFMKHGMTLDEARSINDGIMNRAVAAKVASRGE